jgi:hypothetical protein
MLLDIPKLGKAKKNINWRQFKQLISGSKEQKAEVCKILGWAKPVDLRKGLINMSKKGLIHDAYWDERRRLNDAKASGKKSIDSDDDDDEDAE